MSDRPTADVSVRTAWGADADAIGRLQVRAWQESYVGVVPSEVLATLPADAFAEQWHRSITRPREARERVLVALERATVRGFVATAPAKDIDADPGADGEIVELVVDPEYRGSGHGSRLVHAAVDTLRADKFQRATVWLNASADDLRAFLVAQGWDADGGHRELDLDGDGAVRVKQVRLHTAL
ncbi:MAG TPA: GNAT family N-acetyltransferase [Nocardioidaceae bacterium]|nr:GNAT family N-acetyltransferase [Nocardioidaceae bacterium]